MSVSAVYRKHIVSDEEYPLWPYSLRVSNRLKLVGMVGTCCAVSSLLFLFNPITSGFYPPCLFYLATGLYCPGCGTARALYQLLHGNVLKALDFNPLMMVTLPFLIYGLVSYVLVGLGRRGFPRLFATPFWTYAVYSIIAVYWVARNIPVYPFNVLAP